MPTDIFTTTGVSDRIYGTFKVRSDLRSAVTS